MRIKKKLMSQQEMNSNRNEADFSMNISSATLLDHLGLDLGNS